ncbi:MAG: hypothetical protein Q9M91_06100 [Candidatus Dojkabacteria bacterium]|nr:hypothetical protein [Candidatus Dojkabacteria bacterium]
MSDKYKEIKRQSKSKKQVKSSGSLSIISKGLDSNPLTRVIKEIFTNKSLFAKVGITILIIMIFRAMATIPLPGIDMDVYQEFFGASNATESNYLFTLFTGGQLDSPSIVGLGIAAFINASIIIQLLTPVIPKLHELSKEGQTGNQRIQQYTRYLTLPLSFMYSSAYILFLSRRDLTSGSTSISSATDVGRFLISSADGSQWPSIAKVIFMALILTAGSLFVMWLSELITEKGIGNGSSIIIAIGILSSLPGYIRNDFSGLNILDAIGEVLSGSFAILNNFRYIDTQLVLL